jgi:hypothetical protein
VPQVSQISSIETCKILTGNLHFFAEYLFILETEVGQFQIEFSRISLVQE